MSSSNLNVLNTLTIEATVLDLKGILVERDTHTNNAANDDDVSVSAIVSFARRPHRVGESYATSDQQTSAASLPIRLNRSCEEDGRNGRRRSKISLNANEGRRSRSRTNHPPQDLLQEYEAVWSDSNSNLNHNITTNNHNEDITENRNNPNYLACSSVPLSANFYNVRKETYDVMVHLVKGSEPIPLAVGKLVVRESDLSKNDGCAFMVNLNVKALFRRIYNSDNNDDPKNNKERPPQASPSRRETVLSFALSNGYTYGISTDAILRIRLDVKKQALEDISHHSIDDPSFSENVHKLLTEGTSNKGLSTDDPPAHITMKPMILTRLESKESNLTTSSHGNVNPEELLGLESSQHRATLTAEEAHQRHLQKLEKLKKKHAGKDLEKDQILWALQNNFDEENSVSIVDNSARQVASTPESAKEHQKEKKQSTILSLANLILDFNPCLAQCDNLIDLEGTPERPSNNTHQKRRSRNRRREASKRMI